MWCEKLATHYCDAAIGFEAVGAIRDKAGNVTALLAGGGKSWTCDAPMCAEHAKMIGHVSGSQPDTIDRCPYHAEHRERPMKELVMFEHEALARRRQVHAEIRRALLTVKCSN